MDIENEDDTIRFDKPLTQSRKLTEKEMQANLSGQNKLAQWLKKKGSNEQKRCKREARKSIRKY